MSHVDTEVDLNGKNRRSIRITERIQLINPRNQKRLREHGDRLTDDEGHGFPWREGAYRFVENENYATSFGYQWNRFRKTQLDCFQRGRRQSRERFFAATGWDKTSLSGQSLLEVGSGAGRFSQVVLEHTDAELFSVDVSNAVEANYRNNGGNDRLHLFQASIYELPFAPAQFDKVFCFGVLQHTPDVRRSIGSLVGMVRPGGELVVDFYPLKGWYTKVHIKYLLRPITKRMDHQRLLNLIEGNADRLIAAYRLVQSCNLRRVVRRLLPICDIDATLPRDLSPERLREWVILDTFDMFSPQYDQPQRISTVERWFRELGMSRVWAGFVHYGEDNTAAIVKGTR